MTSTSKDRVILASLLALSLVPALAGAVRLAQLAGGAEPTTENARFINAPLPIALHIPAAVLYSVLGAFQFTPGFRARHRQWHRRIGRVLIPLALLVAITGLWMAHFYPWPAGDGLIVYAERMTVGVAMLAWLGIGVNALRRRDFRAHGDWMLRAYAIALGAGTQVFTHLPWFLLADQAPGELPRGVMMGAGWIVNALVAEWIIWRARHPASRSSMRIPLSA